MVLEYVAWDTQLAPVFFWPVGHIPPKTYIEESPVEAVGEKDIPAARKLELKVVSLRTNCKEVQVPF
jgi:uncharacterized protein YcnI